MNFTISNLGDHIFIGYKKIILNETIPPLSIPIIVAKDLDYDDANEYSNGLISHCSIFVNDNEECKNFTLYLPYLNQLIGLYKMNIYELIDDGMIFIDENGINITELINNHFKEINKLTSECLRKKLEIDSKFGEKKIYEFDDKFPSTPEYEQLNVEIIEKNKKIRNKKHKIYNEKLVLLKQMMNDNYKFKRLIQRLEINYPMIIEPVLSFVNKSPNIIL
jgi:hypothetical protein